MNIRQKFYKIRLKYREEMNELFMTAGIEISGIESVIWNVIDDL